MQKWEYLLVKNILPVYYDDHGNGYSKQGDKDRVHMENGQESDGRNLEAWDVANQKGNEGWELVSCEQGYNQVWDLVFKRLK